MGALSRLLQGDLAAKAGLLTVLGAGPLPAAAESMRQAPAPAASQVVTEEQIVLALLGEEANMKRVVGMLRDSTDRCLSGQARLLQDVASIPSGDATRAALKGAVVTRASDMADVYRSDASGKDADRMLASGHLMADSEASLARHAQLRDACLSWSNRAIVFLDGKLSEPGTKDVGVRLAEAKEASGRDLERLMAMRGVDDGQGQDVIQTMETNFRP